LNYTRSSPHFSNSSILTGVLPASLATTPGPAAVNLGWDGGDYVLETSSTVGGYWCTGVNDCNADNGNGSTWSLYSSSSTATVPTLSAAVLGALGLLLAGASVLLMRSRRTARA
jgi:hypothetical protein